jgi:hypothetical protein
MIKKGANETWKHMQFAGHKSLTKKYAVSNLGRCASFLKDIYADGKILIGSNTSGYSTLNLHTAIGNITIYLHVETAKHFCIKTSSKHKFVIHKNHKKTDNRVTNLVWVTNHEKIAHTQKSPAKIAFVKSQKSKTQGQKLNEKEVRAIKAILSNDKRKLTIDKIAEKFSVSPMSIYRIKSGENWSHVL